MRRERPATAVDQANPPEVVATGEPDSALSSLLSDGVLDFDLGDLGDNDDEGLPTGKNLKPFWAEIVKGISLEEWRTKMKKAMDREPKLKWVGKLLLDAILSLKTALGNFARTHANPEELPPGDEPTSLRSRRGQHGDLMPIHPALVVQGLEGISTDNLHWVRLILLGLDFMYCSAWSKAVCVPMARVLTTNQKEAIKRIGEQVNRFISREDRLPPAKAAAAKLCSKKFDYNGQPVEHMRDLIAEKVLKAWPKVGSAAVVDLRDCLPEELRTALDRPRDFLLPEAELPERHRGSKVRASDEEWHKIVKAGYDRGMFVAVDDREVPRDKQGHLITNGAGAVVKMKKEGGRDVEAQRFISVLCPTNDAMRLLPGAQDKLPYIGQLTAILAERDSYLVLDSEDLQSAFNLFRMPLEWASMFSFAQKVRGDALGGSRNVTLRPALRVVPMGWTSAVTLIQAAIRHIAYTIAKIPPHGDVTMDQELPSGGAMTILYLDNYDEIRHLKKELAEKETGEQHPGPPTQRGQAALWSLVWHPDPRRLEDPEACLRQVGGALGPRARAPGQWDHAGALPETLDRQGGFCCRISAAYVLLTSGGVWGTGGEPGWSSPSVANAGGG